MKNRIILVIAVILILAGIGVIIYPKISSMLYSKEMHVKKEHFDSQKNDSENTKYDELYEKLKKLNEELYINNQSELKDPFSYQENALDLTEYGIEENIIAYIEIPKMNSLLPVILGANTENLKKGAVHLTQTSYPIGGENTNCVIGAHSGYSLADMFNNIDLLEIGDKVYIHNFKETLNYEVYDIEIINPNDIEKLKIQRGKDIVTLITCYPFRVNTHRYIVYCKRI